MKVFDIHIKPTKQCNLRCRYCFEQKHHESAIELDIGKIEAIFKKIKYFCVKKNISKINLNFTGGEVFVLGLDYWKRLICLQKEMLLDSGVKTAIHFQTNLTLLKQEHVDFIKKNKVILGSSIDPFSNARLFKSTNRSVTPIVIDKLKLLLKNNLTAGLIVMITRDNFKKGGEIYEILNNLKVFPFHTLVLTPDTYKYAPELAISGKEYGEAIIEMLKRYISLPAKKRVRVNTLTSYINNIKKDRLVSPPSMCTFSKYCLGDRIFIENDGSVYPCDCLQSSDFYLGNVFKTSLVKIVHDLESRRIFKRLKKRHERHRDECKGCRFCKLCNGGCIAFAYWEGDEMSKSKFYCQLNKTVYSFLAANKN